MSIRDLTGSFHRLKNYGSIWGILNCIEVKYHENPRGRNWVIGMRCKIPDISLFSDLQMGLKQYSFHFHGSEIVTWRNGNRSIIFSIDTGENKFLAQKRSDGAGTHVCGFFEGVETPLRSVMMYSHTDAISVDPVTRKFSWGNAYRVFSADCIHSGW